MFRFYYPWALLLLPLPFLIRWAFPAKIKKIPTAPELSFPWRERLESAFSSSPIRYRTQGIFFLFLSWLFFVIALMQPEKIDHFKKVENKGYDLMLAVDISASMQAVDFSTQSQIISRLDATKEVVSRFISAREGDRVGLVTFGENAYLHVPLTLDTASVGTMLKDTVSGMAGNGTAIGDAIGLCVKTLKNRPEGSRVLVLLTDGEDNASSIPPLEAAKLAKQYGIRIYTIGVGSHGPVPFPNRLGGYGMAHVPMDEELLKEIAEITGGRYFLAADKKMLESVYSSINELEKSKSDQTMYLIREPLFVYPLSLSMFFLLAALGVTLWQRSRRHAS